MNKTLYISDLDGTLLGSDQRVSAFTASTVNSLIDAGMIFSYASQRSPTSIKRATYGIEPKFPMVVYNGAFISSRSGKERLAFKHFSAEDTARILDMMLLHDVYPIVYTFIGDIEGISYVPEKETEGVKAILKRRGVDFRNRPTDVEGLYKGDVFFFACIDEVTKIHPLYERLKDDFECIYSTDLYCGAQRLDIFPKNVTKANAVLELKEILQCDKIVCFGDGENDIPLFEIADECYAMENAIPKLKSIATNIIGANTADGVANWLIENYGK